MNYLQSSKHSLCATLLALTSLSATAQPLSESVQFYFSDAGGSDARLFTDVVTGVNWTREYDVYVKNVWHSPIEYNGATLMVGYGSANSLGPAATLTPFSDLVSIRFPEQANQPISSNPNILLYPSWLVEGPGGEPFLGGASGPPTGQPRPYGLDILMGMPLGTIQTLAVGETALLAKIAFKNRFLFQLGGETILSLSSGSGSIIGSTALRDTRDPNLPKSYRTANWEQNSTLRLTPVPEPATLFCVGIGSMVLLRRKSRR